MTIDRLGRFSSLEDAWIAWLDALAPAQTVHAECKSRASTAWRASERIRAEAQTRAP